MNPSRIVIFLVLLISLPGLIIVNSCSKTEQPTAKVPTVTTDPLTNITQTSATGGGNVTSGGGITVRSRGVCWSTSPSPTTNSNITSDGDGVGTFTSSLTGLSPNTTYYVRAYASNNVGTGYGNEQMFTTQNTGPGTTVTDYDGNVYHTVTIGTQTWLKENLKVTHFNKGEAIPNVSDGIEWSTLTKGAYCNYDKNPANSEIYGHLYNWFAASDSRNPCPEGWHVPTDNEWQKLMDYLGGELIAGGKLKATGTLGQGTGLWEDPNSEATNESGFTALPAGIRNTNGTFSLLSTNEYFWSSTPNQASAWDRELSHKYGNVDRNSREQTSGLSIRCVKDN